MKPEVKRQNFNITPEQEAEVAWLKEAINASSAKDVYLWAVHLSGLIAREVQSGRSIYLTSESGEKERLIIPELEKPSRGQWKYLVARPHPWRRQLYVKGRRLLASVVWMDMLVNDMSKEEAAENWDLPIEAVDEIMQYCESHRSLIDMEADEELRLLKELGVSVEPKAAP